MRKSTCIFDSAFGHPKFFKFDAKFYSANTKALEYHLKALEMRQKLYDYDHPYIARSLNNVGLIFGKLNDKNKALEYKLKALDMYQRLYNGDHP